MPHLFWTWAKLEWNGKASLEDRRRDHLFLNLTMQEGGYLAACSVKVRPALHGRNGRSSRRIRKIPGPKPCRKCLRAWRAGWAHTRTTGGSQMNAEEVLAKYPTQIRKTEDEVFDRKQAMEGLRLKLRLREADLAEAIAKETLPAAEGEKPKPRYTNADARSSALERALQHDDEAKAAKRQIVEAEALIQRMQSSLDFFRDVQRNARVLVLARSPASLVFDEEAL